MVTCFSFCNYQYLLTAIKYVNILEIKYKNKFLEFMLKMYILAHKKIICRYVMFRYNLESFSEIKKFKTTIF